MLVVMQAGTSSSTLAAYLAVGNNLALIPVSTSQIPGTEPNRFANRSNTSWVSERTMRCFRQGGIGIEGILRQLSAMFHRRPARLRRR
jgi:hypothetical protein